MLEFCVDCKCRRVACDVMKMLQEMLTVISTVFPFILTQNDWSFVIVGVLSENEDPCDIPDGFYDKLMP